MVRAITTTVMTLSIKEKDSTVDEPEIPDDMKLVVTE